MPTASLTVAPAAHRLESSALEHNVFQVTTERSEGPHPMAVRRPMEPLVFQPTQDGRDRTGGRGAVRPLEPVKFHDRGPEGR